MDDTRFECGMQILSEVDGSAGNRVLTSLEGIAPDVGRYIAEFAFGDVYARPGLSLQEREMLTIAVLTALGGCEEQLRVHINGGLNVGLPPEKVVEVIIQCIPYTGFPRVLNGIFTAKKVFGERGTQ